MSEILIFAGTTEGRKLSECLVSAGISHTICVATEYGEIVLKDSPLAKVHCGRMNKDEIEAFITQGDYLAVIDATHPYADVITENIRLTVQNMDIVYMRLKRDTHSDEIYENTVRFNTNSECAEALKKVNGNILLTTGVKELSQYSISDNLKSRLYARVLPSEESIVACINQGLRGKQIIAMQGPFTVEMNEALIHQYNISCLVTKQSGIIGGYSEKIEAARNAGIPVFIIGYMQNDTGYSFYEVCKEIEKITNKIITLNGHMDIVLAGVGMGDKGSLTNEVNKAIEEADILLGAERMLKQYKPRIEKQTFYLSNQIIPYLKNMQKKMQYSDNIKTVILFSGDSGFYSGCKSVYNALKEEIDKGNLKASVRIMPGISSVAYFAACIGESYQDSAVLSMHGKDLCNLANRIKSEKSMFVLMSGVKDVNKLGQSLIDADLSDCEISLGYQLSYEDQKILKLLPKECCELKDDGLYTCFIKNLRTINRELTHGIADEEFIRDKVPMTKEEVREVSICKLKLNKSAIVYDIGSGTGSIAIEIARLSDNIRVFAIEQKKEAVYLIEQNKKRFMMENISVIEAKAPDRISELPKATHAFIGGNGGNLKEILSVLYAVNFEMRIVINAVTIETIAEIKEILLLFPTVNEEIIQIQVSEAKKVGHYHLMQAGNPVWICSFNFKKEVSEV